MVRKKDKKESKPTPKPSKNERWDFINLLARAYLEMQRARMSFTQRMYQMENIACHEKGLMELEIKHKKNARTGKSFTSRRYLPVDDTKATIQAIEIEKGKLGGNFVYDLLSRYENTLARQEDGMLEEAKEIFELSALWKWCLNVRGLGPVAALTFMGYFNPDPRQTRHIGTLWRRVGLSPGSFLRRGEQARMNPKIKGRLWMIGNNVIKARDSYYYMIYKYKKDFFAKRPDMVALRDGKVKLEKEVDNLGREHVVRAVPIIGNEAQKKAAQIQARSWKGMIHAYALFNLRRILVHHAYEILVREYKRLDHDEYLNLQTKQTEGKFKRHRNDLAIKPEDVSDQREILINFRKKLSNFHMELKKRWNDKTDIDHTKYFEYLRHPEII